MAINTHTHKPKVLLLSRRECYILFIFNVLIILLLRAGCNDGDDDETGRGIRGKKKEKNNLSSRFYYPFLPFRLNISHTPQFPLLFSFLTTVNHQLSENVE